VERPVLIEAEDAADDQADTDDRQSEGQIRGGTICGECPTDSEAKGDDQRSESDEVERLQPTLGTARECADALGDRVVPALGNTLNRHGG
jgi:hypothetical protein